jgi:YidC/Oxa1 family membrane protein insertase
MVSDWSGAALEYAFGLERPVLFVDVARKVNNPEYEKLDREPFEATVREQIGRVVAVDALDQVPALTAEVLRDPDAFSAQIRQARADNVFNLGTSGTVAADVIEAKAALYLRKNGLTS